MFGKGKGSKERNRKGKEGRDMSLANQLNRTEAQIRDLILLQQLHDERVILLTPRQLQEVSSRTQNALDNWLALLKDVVSQGTAVRNSSNLGLKVVAYRRDKATARRERSRAVQLRSATPETRVEDLRTLDFRIERHEVAYNVAQRMLEELGQQLIDEYLLIGN